MTSTTTIDVDVALNEALNREKFLRDRCLVLAQSNKSLTLQMDAMRTELEELRAEAKAAGERDGG